MKFTDTGSKQKKTMLISCTSEFGYGNLYVTYFPHSLTIVRPFPSKINKQFSINYISTLGI